MQSHGARKAGLSGHSGSPGHDLALTHPADPRFYGELVRFGDVLPWDAEIEPQASAAVRVSAAR